VSDTASTASGIGPGVDLGSIMEIVTDMIEHKGEIVADLRAKRELEQDRMVFRRPPMHVDWATCRTCSRQAVPLEDELCDICGPVAAATAVAFRS
jgi:hypothetical protein